MKKISKYLLSFGLIACTFSACDDGDALVDQIVADTTSSPILRTLQTINPDFNRNNLDSTWDIQVELQDEEGGTLVREVQLTVDFRDNKDDGTDFSKDPVPLRTIPFSEFSTGERGLPVTNISVALSEAINLLGLSPGQFDGGDIFRIGVTLVLNDGTTVSRADSSGRITGGSFFSSPFQYDIGIVCLNVPTPGDWILAMRDSYGDGWDGANITVNIDGNKATYTVDAGSAADVTINIPDGSEFFLFTYNSGNFEGEHTYTLTDPNGMVVIDDGPSPTVGEQLNPCN